MAQKTAPLLPEAKAALGRFGERLRLARLRRRLSAKQVAERAGMAPMTLRSLERGSAGVTIGAYAAVMQVLGLQEDLERLAQEDPFGRSLQDASLPQRPRSSVAHGVNETPRAALGRRVKSARKRGVKDKPDIEGWAEAGGFASAKDLASLLTPSNPTSRRRR
ncbi:MAG: helix-turn-helix domain-containing protein [Alphaproteobacteria bacterium]|nr:MAG: helix-turn-helix domain-containing protein [Alphaproteobacteria bacterium]